MAFTLISIITLASTAIAVPVPQLSEGPTACKATYYSKAGDTCRSIGLPWGYYDTDILAANTFLDCDDIWENTPICIPNIPTPTTVTYGDAPVNPTAPPIFLTTSATPIPLPTPSCLYNILSAAGDTCGSLGAQYGVTGEDILAANSFLDCGDILVGTPICIPAIFYPPTMSFSSSISASPVPSCASTYVVPTTGETCDSIGAQFGVSGADILNYNSFLNCQDIWQWTSVCIPYPVITDIFPTVSSTTVTAVPVPTCASTYVVPTTGETCDSIGAKFGVSGPQILSSNSFLNCQDIWQWTQVCIPYPIISDPFPTVTYSSSGPNIPTCITTHISVANETCDTIGAQYGISGTEVLNANTFLDCNDIWIGTPVCITTWVVVDPPMTYDPNTEPTTITYADPTPEPTESVV